jgi:release factor glutamine methyltransferase
MNGRIVRALRAGGCVAPEREAEALLEASAAGAGAVDDLVGRRLHGEPLAWVVGWAELLGVRVAVDPGVFVPRPHTEVLARRAIELLPDDGVAVDLCTGSGAVAAVLLSARPAATVVATDVDPAAIACARRNGVRALLGDLDGPIPRALLGRVDVVTAVVPYVPTGELRLLPRDVVDHEPRRALDGGADGTETLARAAAAARRWLRPGGHVLLELGGDQAAGIAPLLRELGFAEVRVLRDEDGLDRAIEAVAPSHVPHEPMQHPA